MIYSDGTAGRSNTGGESGAQCRGENGYTLQSEWRGIDLMGNDGKFDRNETGNAKVCQG